MFYNKGDLIQVTVARPGTTSRLYEFARVLRREGTTQFYVIQFADGKEGGYWPEQLHYLGTPRQLHDTIDRLGNIE